MSILMFLSSLCQRLLLARYEDVDNTKGTASLLAFSPPQVNFHLFIRFEQIINFQDTAVCSNCLQLASMALLIFNNLWAESSQGISTEMQFVEICITIFQCSVFVGVQDFLLDLIVFASMQFIIDTLIINNKLASVGLPRSSLPSLRNHWFARTMCAYA